MIRMNKVKNDSVEMMGFDVSIPSPMLINIGAGSYKFNVPYRKSPDLYTREFDEFNFLVEPDDEVSVAYDVYLLREPLHGLTVAVERTELGVGIVPFYDGEGCLLHTLLTFIVPAGATDLEGLEIRASHLVLDTGEGA